MSQIQILLLDYLDDPDQSSELHQLPHTANSRNSDNSIHILIFLFAFKNPERKYGQNIYDEPSSYIIKSNYLETVHQYEVLVIIRCEEAKDNVNQK